MIINSISARRILDSRGEWTIEVRLKTAEESTGTVGILQGKSTGSHEAEYVDVESAIVNVERMQKAKDKGSCNGVIIKLNQIGTLTETLKAVAQAREWGWKVIVSHRSGETTGDFIADLAVGIGADGFKLGAPVQGERVAKYNRLLEIAKEMI